jgi:hypothetical protein
VAARPAGKDTIIIADLADEQLRQDPAAVPEWRDIATEMPNPARARAPIFHTVGKKLGGHPEQPPHPGLRGHRSRPPAHRQSGGTGPGLNRSHDHPQLHF